MCSQPKEVGGEGMVERAIDFPLLILCSATLRGYDRCRPGRANNKHSESLSTLRALNDYFANLIGYNC